MLPARNAPVYTNGAAAVVVESATDAEFIVFNEEDLSTADQYKYDAITYITLPASPFRDPTPQFSGAITVQQEQEQRQQQAVDGRCTSRPLCLLSGSGCQLQATQKQQQQQQPLCRRPGGQDLGQQAPARFAGPLRGTYTIYKNCYEIIAVIATVAIAVTTVV